MSAIGSITGNDPAGFTKFGTYLGKSPTYALLAFNQSSPAQLWDSVGYICAQGKAFIAAYAQVIWSVPCPGAGQLEAIAAGTWSTEYAALFRSIVAATPTATQQIYIRLPWEFNLAGQENAARDKSGNWDAPLFVAAWKVLATLAKAASRKVKIIWCPNVTTQAIDPELCWPGVGYVDIIAQDFYMQKAWNKPGDFSWFRDEARGLAWGAAFAASKSQHYALPEWGMDSDAFLADFEDAGAWVKRLGSAMHHHCWWDRPEVIDCRISDDSHPALSAGYKSAFG